MPDYQVGSTRLYGHSSRQDFMRDVAEAQSARDRAETTAMKHMRLPVILRGVPASNAIAFTVGNGFNLGPAEGYAWSLRRLVVSGLTSGTTPDTVSLYTHNIPQYELWQFNGNNFGYTFGARTLTLWPGDRLELVSSGTINSTSLVALSGELDEAPAEMMMKIRA